MRGGQAARPSEFVEYFDYAQICADCVGLETRKIAAVVASFEARVFVYKPPVKTAVYRAVRYESYPEFAACGKHAVIFDCAVHQVVFALYCGYRADCVRASDCGSSHFAHSEFQGFPLLYELGDGFGYGFRRGFGIGAVLVKYADCLDAQTS